MMKMSNNKLKITLNFGASCVYPAQTAHKGALWSGSLLLAILNSSLPHCPLSKYFQILGEFKEQMYMSIYLGYCSMVD